MDVRPRLARGAERTLALALVASPLVCLLGAFLLTAGTDETWILHGVRGLAAGGRYGSASPFTSVYSTGGPYTVLATVLEWAGGGRLLIPRLLSIISLASLLVLLYRRTPSVVGAISGPERWIAVSPLLAVHGTFLIGSQAYVEILATLLLFAGGFLWSSRPPGTWSRRLGAGLLLGLAAATRLNLVVGLAAILASTVVFARRREEIVDAILSTVTGAAAFWLQWKGLAFISVDAGDVARGSASYGLSSGPILIGYVVPQRLGYVAIAGDFVPLAILVAVSAGWVWARARVSNPRAPDFLLTFGWILWASWLARSPIPHLRYLWPGLAAFAYVGGLVLAVFYGQAAGLPSPNAFRSGVLAFALALVISGYAEASRTLVSGDSDVLAWEWQRGCPYSLQYGPFKPARAQRDAARRLQQIPPEQGIATVGFDTALAYLCRRTVVPIQACYPPCAEVSAEGIRPNRLPIQPLPRWLVLTPIVNRHRGCHMSPVLHRWMEENCILRERFGPYILYEITGRLPETPEVFRLDDWEPRAPLSTDADGGGERKKS